MYVRIRDCIVLRLVNVPTECLILRRSCTLPVQLAVNNGLCTVSSAWL